MLTVFRIVLVGPPPIEDTARGCGSAVVGAGVDGGGKVVEGARRPVLGVLLPECESVAMPPVLCRVLLMGNAGSAAVGGPFEGRDALGSVAAMLMGAGEENRGRGSFAGEAGAAQTCWVLSAQSQGADATLVEAPIKNSPKRMAGVMHLASGPVKCRASPVQACSCGRREQRERGGRLDPRY